MSSCKNAFHELVDHSQRAYVADAKTTSDIRELRPQPSILAPDVDSGAESRRTQVLVEKLDFLRDSCKIVFAQKNHLLARKDADISRLKTLLAQKDNEVASLKARLASAHQTVATVTIERDEAVARASIIVHDLDQIRADYDSKIASLTSRAADAESSAETLRTIVQQQKTKLSAALLENNDLNAELTRARDVYDSHLESCRTRESNDARTIARQSTEIVMLTKRLKEASRQRAAPASPLYRFQSFMSRRSSESDSDSSFYWAKPSPPRWRRFMVMRRARKGDSS
ncbi:hypothetical protein V8D89_005416 [Ganoderma adspersum]